MNKFIAPLVIAALVVAAGIYLFTGGSDDKTVTAHFPRTVSVYEGSDVRVLGVSIGKVTKVQPTGTDVTVTMQYDSETDVPADAKALIVAPSVVGDRYIQLSPGYSGGAVMKDGAELQAEQTAVPLELDEIYESMDELVVALGPDGANKNGALDDLLQQTAKNFGGQGEKLNQTINDVATVSKTFDENSEEFWGSAEQLEKFTKKLAQNDDTVREFAQDLEDVSAMLAGERKDLAASLRNLSTALSDVRTFVQDNKADLKDNIDGLNRLTGVIVNQRESLDEALRLAPVAINNLLHAYNPDTGTLDTNANIGELVTNLVSSPGSFLCGVLQEGTGGDADELCNTVKSILPRSGALGQGTGSFSNSPHDPTLGGLVPQEGE